MRHESKCATLHGHRYAAEVTCEADALDKVGRVIDFGAVKEIVGSWIDREWDHTTLVNYRDDALILFCAAEEASGKRAAFIFDGEPTAENIAKELHRVASALLQPRGVRVTRVRVYETPNCWADHA